MTPPEARDSLTTITHETAELLGVDGWEESGAPSVASCGDGVKWAYSYAAPIPDAAHLENAQKVADYWEKLGMTVRINTEFDPVVFATGGPLQGISFSTGPGTYSIDGTSLCVPGDVNDWR